ncbi:MAG: DUF262 domain-containing protein [Paludibacteraceae bacterium]|nr:DUF262 domain-containing protein [Paludibacteraceae bacterium]
MNTEKFTNTTLTIKALLGLIEAKDIAIPEIQRPFVWKSTQVRDLIDSLYKGYPTGYIILWRNPNIKLKDGTVSSGKKVIIDGQQRITALMTAIAGLEIFNSEYKQARVKIAFDPFAALEYINGNSEAEIFAVQTPAHLKSKRWITDIASIFDTHFSSWTFIPQYIEQNPEMNGNDLQNVLNMLKGIETMQIGVVELSEKLDIDVVTDIFIRINSKGTPLSQGDFVMSKMAADEIYGGNTLRKIIDYFAHLVVVPTYYDYIKNNDVNFVNAGFLDKLAWLADDKETVYDPTCDDVIRVAFMHKVKRAKLSNLVQLLNGRDFETREYKEEIAENTFKLMYEGVFNVINKYNFTQFMIAIKSAGFISDKMVTSNMALDFAYTIFFLLQESEIPVAERKRIVQKWYVISILTGRYSSSPESSFAKDLRQITEFGIVNVLKSIENATLSDNFWNVEVPQNLTMTSTNNPTYLVYLAAQVYFNDISLLSANVTVRELIALGGDIHHIFPKKYLINNNFPKNLYNQNANYVYLDRPVNESIGMKAPNIYFSLALEQCITKIVKCGSILEKETLLQNLKINCIPESVFTMDYTNYNSFLNERRVLMAQKIKDFYCKL